MSTVDMSQSLSALAAANRVRDLRTQLRLELSVMGPREARRQVAGVLLDPPAFVETLPVGTLLRWIPRVGPETVEALCAGACVLSHRPIVRPKDAGRDGLCSAERERLASVLTGGKR